MNDLPPSLRFHSAVECRIEVDALLRRLAEVERLLDAKVAESMYRVRKNVPRLEEEKTP